MSLFTVCYMNSSEHTYFVGNSYGTIAIKLIAFFVLLFAYSYTNNKYGQVISVKNERVIEYLLLGAILVVSLVWIFSVRANAVSDQYQVMAAASELLNGDFSSFETGGYISYYTVQMGLVIVHYFMALLFGPFNYLAFQIVSAIAVMFTWKQLYDIAKIMRVSAFDRILLLVVGLLFLPYTFYSSFVYGTVLGFVFAIAAIKYELQFIEGYKWRNAVLAALFISISIFVKPNYLIFLVGMLASLIVWMIEKNKKEAYLKGLVAILLIMILYIGQSVGTKTFIEHKTGQKMDKSMSSIAWLEMGLQEGVRAPGWYNQYNYQTYIESDCNPAAQKERVLIDLKDSLNEMIHHKGDTINFFSRKVASEWMNPSFQSLWTMGQTASVGKQRSEFIEEFIGTRGTILFTSVFSIFESLFLMGICSYSLLKLKNGVFNKKDLSLVQKDEMTDLSEFILEIVFFGGFLFYFFWEAKGQYTIVYVVMLSIFFVKGLDILKSDIRVLILPFFLGICIVLASKINVHVADLICLNKDEEAFGRYRNFFVEEDSYLVEGVPTEEITLAPALNENYCLINDGEALLITDISADIDSDISEDNGSISIKGNGRTSRIVFEDGRVLKWYMNGDDGYNLEAGTKASDDGQFWRIDGFPDGEGCRIYSCQGYALSYNEENNSVYLSEISDDLSQRWYVR